MSSTARAARYVRTWLSDGADLTVLELDLDRDGRTVPGTLYRPRHVRAPLPSWVVLHGMTRPGRHHVQLVRFARALASTGAVVLVPEVPEWVALRLAPHLTVPTVRAALDGLADVDEAETGPSGLAGFSFGAPQAIAASGAPGVRGRCAGTVAFGGYAGLADTVRFQITGRHRDDEGRELRHRPDPYGRWIVAGNYLTAIPGLEGRVDLAEALLELAREAGDRGIPSWDPRLDAFKAGVRDGVAPDDRPLFDLLLRGAENGSDAARGRELADALADAAERTDPAIDAVARFDHVAGPVHILHGRNDHLIPYTEAERLAAALPDDVERRVTVTRLFGHSAQDPFPWLSGPRESFRFFRALARMLKVA